MFEEFLWQKWTLLRILKEGLSILGKEEVDHAIADLTEAIRLNPNDVKAYRYRSEAHSRKNEFDHVIADLTVVIQLTPGDAIAYYNRGSAYFEKNDFEHAIADLETVVKLEPNNAQMHEALNKIKRSARKNSYDGSMKASVIITIVGGVIGAILGGINGVNITHTVNLGFVWFSVLVGAFFGSGIGPFWGDFGKLKEELIIWFSAILGAIKDSRKDDVEEGGFLKGNLLWLLFIPLRFLFGLFIFSFWPGLKLFVKFLVCPFVAFHRLRTGQTFW